MVSEQPKMKRSITHRKPILLYCSQATQTHDDSEAEDSDFPPCREGNSPPLISRYSPVQAIPSRSRYPRAAASGIQPTTSSKGPEEPPQSRRRQKPNAGLGQANVVNVVDSTAPVLNAKVVPYIPYMW